MTLPFEVPSIVWAILLVLGLLVILKMFVQFAKFIYYLFSCCGTNLAERYGRGSYVVVTGSTSGIGRAFAFEFARLGFNLILIDKNNMKLEETKSELSKASPSTKVEIHMLDMAFEANCPAIERLAQRFFNYDISLLINNAGIILFDEYTNLSPSEIEQLINVNILSMTLITHQFLNKLKGRGKSGIIFVSSLTGLFEFPYLQAYTASKNYTDFFSMSLRSEYPMVDIMLDRCGHVQTNSYRGELGLFCCTAEAHVKAVLVDFPKRRHTYGILAHRILSSFTKTFQELPKQLLRVIKRNRVGADDKSLYARTSK